jgi:hypothetical protein
MIARMRAAALNYSDQLENFTCIQLTSRSADNKGTGKRWKPLETQETELTYIAHKENYKLPTVNGKSTDLEKRVKQGVL